MVREYDILIKFINEKVKEDWDIPPQFRTLSGWEGLTEDEMRTNLETGLASLTHKELQQLVKYLIKDIGKLIKEFTTIIPTELRDVTLPSLSPQENSIPKIVDTLLALEKVFKEFREIGYDLTSQVVEHLVIIPLKFFYKTRYENDVDFFEYFIRHLPPLKRKDRHLTEEILLQDYVFQKIRDHWKVSPEYGPWRYNLWRRLSPKDIRSNLEFGIQNTFDPVDLKLLVIFINSDIKNKKINVPKLDNDERNIDAIVDTIIELGRTDEDYLGDSIRNALCYVYYEKFRHDAGLKTLANEKLPNRDGIKIPY